MIKKWLRKWLGIEALEAELSSLTHYTPKVVKEDKSISGALKSMTPYERSLEDGKEIRERVEYLLK
jgi:hypothetical protein